MKYRKGHIERKGDVVFIYNRASDRMPIDITYPSLFISDLQEILESLGYKLVKQEEEET